MLDPRHWKRVEEILDAALARDRVEWSAVLDELCGDDPPIRQEVEELLGRVDVAESFLSSLPTALVSRLVAEHQPGVGRYLGRRIGAYRLVGELGRGGMARVFLAERADGHFEQKVAVKLLRPGFDSEIDIDRFRAERQILASLNYPSIARLFDGGVTSDGVPYLVLEYVEGQRIDRYCQGHALTVRARLELFLDVVDAVEYAHRRSVIHQDLKPANILVTSDGTVKLLDFGLAKMLEEGVTGEAPSTRTGHRWMTPEYAAPEQVRGTPVTTHTDVYQLGAVLYELLTGHTPFASHAQTPHELEMAALHREPDPLGGALRGDLDAVVRRALCKQPGERYGAAGELAEDIRRYLTGHPVRARRQTIRYRARRFTSRNRVRLAVATIVALVAGASVIAVTIERGRTRHAEEMEALAREMIDVASVEAVADTAGALRLVERGLQAAADPRNQADLSARLLEGAGRIHARLGEHESAFALLQEALAFRRQSAAAEEDGTASDAVGGRAAGAVREVPDGMLFVRPGDIYLMDEDGTHEVRITHSPEAWNSMPAWAPDGRRILLSRLAGASRAVFMVNADGRGMIQLTAPPPGWNDELPHALGEQIVFVRHDPWGGARIYRVNADGTGLASLTRGPHDNDPAPSPNGDFLAFREGNDIYVLDLGRRQVKQLTHTPDQYKAGLAVSPDAKRIAFTRIDPGRLEQIFVMDIDGTHVKRVSRGDYYDYLPRWSPDGTRLGFTSARDGSMGIYSMREDGSDVVDLSRTPGTLVLQPGVSVLHVTENLTEWMKY